MDMKTRVPILMAIAMLGLIAMSIISAWTAGQFGNHPVFGGTYIWGYRVYPPHAVFSWVTLLNGPVWNWPEPFLRGLFMSGAALFVSSLVFYRVIRKQSAKGAGGSDEFGAEAWGTIKDAIAAGLVMGKGSAPKTTPNIVTIGRLGNEFLTVTDNGHVAAFGSAGSGKTRTIVIPSLLSWGGSAIVYTAGKLDVWEITSGFRSKFSDVFLFDLGNPNGYCINPLAEIRVGTDHEIDDCNNIAGEFMPPKKEGEGRKSSDFWDSEGKKLLSAVFLHVRSCYVSKDQNIGTAREILMQPADLVIKELTDSLHPHVVQVASSTLLGDDRARDSTLRTAQSFLDPWASPVVQKLTSSSDFRLSDLMCNERPMTLYLRVPSDMRDEWKPVLKLIIARVVRSMLHDEKRMADGRTKKHRLMFNLDEFHSFGFPSWPSDLSEMRSYGGTAVMVTQSEKTLEGVYGQHQSISANCRVRLYLDAADPDTQKKISDQVGSVTEIRDSKSTSRQPGSLFKKSTSISQSEQTRSLMDGGKARMMSRDQMLALVTGCKPLKLNKLIDFDEREPFRSRLRDPARATPIRETIKKQKSIFEV